MNERMNEQTWTNKHPRMTHHSLQARESRAPTDVVAGEDQVRAQQAPIAGAVYVAELEAEPPAPPAAQLEHEGLVQVPQRAHAGGHGPVEGRLVARAHSSGEPERWGWLVRFVSPGARLPLSYTHAYAYLGTTYTSWKERNSR